MSASITEQLGLHAWEKLPEYGNAPSMTDALSDGVGTCFHRSILIGRRALELGIPSMRRITFGANKLPHHFANYVKPADSWMYISTGRKTGNVTVGNHGYEFDETRMYASFQGLGIEALEVGGSEKSASVVVLPERSMGLFRECVLSQQYLRTAYRLIELT